MQKLKEWGILAVLGLAYVAVSGIILILAGLFVRIIFEVGKLGFNLFGLW